MYVLPIGYLLFHLVFLPVIHISSTFSAAVQRIVLSFRQFWTFNLLHAWPRC